MNLFQIIEIIKFFYNIKNNFSINFLNFSSEKIASFLIFVVLNNITFIVYNILRTVFYFLIKILIFFFKILILLFKLIWQIFKYFLAGLRNLLQYLFSNLFKNNRQNKKTNKGNYFSNSNFQINNGKIHLLAFIW